MVLPNILEVTDMGRYFENASDSVWMVISLYHGVAQYFGRNGYGAIYWERPVFCLNGYFLVSLYRPIFWKSRIWGDMLRTPRILFEWIYPRISMSPNILPFTDMGRYVENAPYSVWFYISSYHCIAQYFVSHGYGAIFWERRVFFLNGYILVSLYHLIFWKSRIWGDMLRTPCILFDFTFPHIIRSPNILEVMDMGRYFENAL